MGNTLFGESLFKKVKLFKMKFGTKFGTVPKRQNYEKTKVGAKISSNILNSMQMFICPV